ncbi:hypothetical protein IV203_033340 [Nitzschia inconspicua]|uniref:Uncharacterized protein n=1 Tax=Nitzschia inconspicua TaxID=303405 RepID=A0A9K3PI48_9STRA|nr:hypothetical protein IV203_033340 [Nitzschia inconspicua]
MAEENNVEEEKTTTEPEEVMTIMLESPPKGIAGKMAFLKNQMTTLEGRITTLEHKITNLEDEITTHESHIVNVEKQLMEKERELESTKQCGNNVAISTTEKLLEYIQERERLRNQKDNILMQQKELFREKEKLFREKVSVLQRQKELETGFLRGEYYACTSEVWEIEEVTREGNEWQSFVRSIQDDDKFDYRYTKEKRQYPKEKSDKDDTPDPYNATKNGALNSKCAVPNSGTASNSSFSQNKKSARDAVWPTDIFGNKLEKQEIAHLVPAGKAVAHKHWLNVAAAVLGIPSTATVDVKKKAARGFIPEEEKHAGGTGGTQSETDSESKEKKCRRMAETGVIHFVTNKIRFANQKTCLDGQTPTVLIVPVMTLDGAKKWRGEGYSAICLAGYPKNNPVSVVDPSNVYVNIKLASKSLLDNTHPRDAKREEVDIACDFLRAAVLALHDMIANLSQEELNLGMVPNRKDNPLQEASEKARDLLCKVPVPVKPLGEKPACLITFGGQMDLEMHPAPDPLLLVLKAANIFGIMADMKMLANGSSDDDSDISMGDIMEEEAFLEARERALRPQTWEDLARGLGQPNGYVESTNCLKQTSFWRYGDYDFGLDSSQ